MVKNVLDRLCLRDLFKKIWAGMINCMTG